MNPVLAFVGGVLIIWIVANGKANAVWQAVFQTQTATRPADPSTGTPSTGTGGTARPGIPSTSG